ncbi:MAG: hypothetical protein WKG00_36125 [Polyangiaceae bacterium]
MPTVSVGTPTPEEPRPPPPVEAAPMLPRKAATKTMVGMGSEATDAPSPPSSRRSKRKSDIRPAAGAPAGAGAARSASVPDRAPVSERRTQSGARPRVSGPGSQRGSSASLPTSSRGDSVEIPVSGSPFGTIAKVVGGLVVLGGAVLLVRALGSDDETKQAPATPTATAAATVTAPAATALPTSTPTPTTEAPVATATAAPPATATAAATSAPSKPLDKPVAAKPATPKPPAEKPPTKKPATSGGGIIRETPF